MQCEKKNPNKQNRVWKIIARKQNFGHNYIQIEQDYTTVPDMRSQWGFQQFVPNVWFSSRVPMVKLFEDETGTFPITTRLPTLRCKTKFSRAMEPLGQNRSRTSLQDRNPTCKRNLWVHFVARSRSRVQRKPFKSDVRHPWEGSGPLLTKNLTGRHLRHSC